MMRDCNLAVKTIIYKSCQMKKMHVLQMTVALLSGIYRINNLILTKLFVNDRGPAEHHSPDEEVKMAEDDKWRRCSRAAVVLLNQLISLKLPYPVCVILNLLEREAVPEHGGRAEFTRLRSGLNKETKTWRRAHLKMAMSRLSSRMLAKSR